MIFGNGINQYTKTNEKMLYCAAKQRYQITADGNQRRKFIDNGVFRNNLPVRDPRRVFEDPSTAPTIGYRGILTKIYGREVEGGPMTEPPGKLLMFQRKGDRLQYYVICDGREYKRNP